MDWLVATGPQGDDLWLPMEGVVELVEVPAYAGPVRLNSASYLLGLVAYDASTGQFTVDPLAFSAFVVSSPAFRDCPPGTFAELEAAASGSTTGQADDTPVDPSQDRDGAAGQADDIPADPSQDRDGAASVMVDWIATVNVVANLRTGPGTDFPMVRVLPAGTRVAVVGVSEDGDWLELDDGTWIYRFLVSRTDQGLASRVQDREGAASVMVDWIATVNVVANLRTGPGTDFPMVRVLPAGTRVAVVGVSEDGDWLELDDGTWIYRLLVSRADQEWASRVQDRDSAASVTVDWIATVNVVANLRAGPGTDFPMVRVLPGGTRVAVVGVSEGGDWLELDDGTWIYRLLVSRADQGLAARTPAGMTGTDISNEPAPDAPDTVAGTSSEADTAGNKPSSPPTAAESVQELRLYMLDLINHERTSRGLIPVNLTYNKGAQLHAEDMVEHGYMSHWNLRGETPSMRHTWAGGHDYSAENLSFRRVLDAPPEYCAPPVSTQDLADVMHSLMGSPGHRDNILRPLHREVNIGIAESCRAMAVAQVFEGEFVRFSHPPSVEAGWFVMAGQVAPEVELSDRTNVMVAWDPPLAGYTKDQVSQTFCVSIVRPVAYIRRPLPAGFMRLDGESQEVDWERCPAPWDADPNLQWPGNEIDELRQRIRGGFRIRETVEVALVTASTWQVEAGSFRFEADLNRVIQVHGPGIYSVILWGHVDGQLEPLTTYSVAVER